MTGNPQDHRKFPTRRFFRLAWRYGGRWGRVLVGLLTVGYILPALPAIWLLVTYGYGIEFCFGIAWIGGGFLRILFVGPLFTIQMVQETVDNGWASAKWMPYYRELIGYLEAYGEDGHVPGSVRWGFIFWALFYLTLLAAAVYGILLVPIIGGLAVAVFVGLDMGMLLGIAGLGGAHTRRTLRVATLRGFRLEELRPHPSVSTATSSPSRP